MLPNQSCLHSRFRTPTPIHQNLPNVACLCQFATGDIGQTARTPPPFSQMVMAAWLRRVVFRNKFTVAILFFADHPREFTRTSPPVRLFSCLSIVYCSSVYFLLIVSSSFFCVNCLSIPWKLKPGFINRALVAVIFEASKCL